MPKYVIEREIPGAGSLTAEQLKSVSQKSCAVLGKLGPKVQWQHSYVTGDRLYCVYIAESEELVREPFQRLMQEQLYSAASIIASPRTAAKDGVYTELDEMTGLKTFVTSLAGHIAAEAARQKH